MHFHQWKRRDIIRLLGGAAATLPLAACGQQDDRVRALQGRILLLHAEGAAAKIGQFIKEIEGQLGWTTQLPLSVDNMQQRRLDALRLLRQVPAITEMKQIDVTGKENLQVSRLADEAVYRVVDWSNSPIFTEAMAKKVYYGPVRFRRESEPYMTLAVAGTRRDAGVSVAEIGIKLVRDVIVQIKAGRSAITYVVDAHDLLIAHSDISPVLHNCQSRDPAWLAASCYSGSDMSKLAQVRAARSAGERVKEAEDNAGRKVLTAYAPVEPLGWFVFVELPVDEIYER